MPVIGGNFELPPIVPGTIYTTVDGANLNLDGVVNVDLPLGADTTFGSGSLMTDGLHIITAAHVSINPVTNLPGPVNVTFRLPVSVPGRVVAPITINVPVAQQFPYPGFVAETQGNDIEILNLTDPATGGLLVAPYYSPNIGYPLVADGFNAVNRTFTMVGYGRTGTGPPGPGRGPQP